MITPSTRAHVSATPSVEARNAPRAEHGGDFREEVSRGRERERTSERTAEATRSSRDAERPSSQTRATRDDPIEREAVRDDATSEAPTPTAVSDGEPVDPEADAAPFGEAAAKRPALSGTAVRSSASKEPAAATEAAKTEAALVVPSTPIANTVALEMIDATHGLEARMHALFAASDDVAPDDRAPKSSATPVTMVGASAPAAAVDAATAIADPSAHVGPELVRSATTSHVSSETASPAIAALAGRTSPTADLASIPTAPVQRLSPADLPQFFETVQVRVDGTLGNAFVELEPPQLGRLTFELSLQPDGGVRADVRAENQDGFAALGARVPEMRAALLDRGFTSADVQISLGLGQREAQRESESKSPRRPQTETTRELDAERVLALATSGGRSIDVWA